MSCMEKSCRADIAFQLMDRMKMEGVAPNVHIYNSAISACARSNLWEKGLELFQEMDKAGVVQDVVSYNAVLDAVSSQVTLGRKLFQEGIERGFYARVSRLGTQWLELDLHFLSLGGGEIALGWWFEECLVPYLVNTSKLAAVKSIDIVTGYGKTRSRGVRHGDDGMRKRVRVMLQYMGLTEVEQANKGRIHIDKSALMTLVQKNNGRIIFDQDGYSKFKEENTTANHIPNVEQKVRPRYTAEHFRDVPLGQDPRSSRHNNSSNNNSNNNHSNGDRHDNFRPREHSRHGRSDRGDRRDGGRDDRNDYGRSRNGSYSDSRHGGGGDRHNNRRGGDGGRGRSDSYDERQYGSRRSSSSHHYHDNGSSDHWRRDRDDRDSYSGRRGRSSRHYDDRPRRNSRDGRPRRESGEFETYDRQRPHNPIHDTNRFQPAVRAPSRETLSRRESGEFRRGRSRSRDREDGTIKAEPGEETGSHRNGPIPVKEGSRQRGYALESTRGPRTSSHR